MKKATLIVPNQNLRNKIATKPSVPNYAMKWEETAKMFPEEIAAIQQWFNETTNTNSKVHFWDQPIWQNDLAIIAIEEKLGLKIATDAKFVSEQKIFRYIYGLMISETQMIKPESHYPTRQLAEYSAYVHCFRLLKQQREEELISDAQVVTE